MSGSDGPGGYTAKVLSSAPWNIKECNHEEFIVRTPIKYNEKIGSLYIPQTAKMGRTQVETCGRVVWIHPEEEERSWLKFGDIVIYGKYTGIDVCFGTDQEKYWYKFIRESDCHFSVFEDQVEGFDDDWPMKEWIERHEALVAEYSSQAEEEGVIEE